jgi:DNA-binding LytR/AlgR family response regulator
MKNLEEQLSIYGFVRVHKSFLVPIKKINKIEGNKISVQNHILPIGDNFKAELFNLLKGKILE